MDTRCTSSALSSILVVTGVLIYRELGGENYILAKLQENLDKTKEVIANICKLKNAQEKLVLLLQFILGRIQHLLAAVPVHLSRDFAKQHE